MTKLDAFALLGVKRQPWFDPGELQEAHLALCKQFHPDVQPDEFGRMQAGAAMASIHEGYEILKNPASRLRHLIELETAQPLPKIEEIPQSQAANLMDLALAGAKVDECLKNFSKSESSLEKASLMPELLEAQDSVDAARTKIGSLTEGVAKELKEMNDQWLKMGVSHLREFAALLSYLRKMDESLARQKLRIQEALLS